MSYNTGNPVPSKDARDYIDNVEFLDGLCNSESDYVNGRLANPRLTAKGFQNQATAAIQATGWFPVAGSFEDGGTITARNQVLWWESAKSWYSWNGTLPKSVAAGSTPATSGGFSPSAGWTDRTDATLRSSLLDRPLYQTTLGLYGLRDCQSVMDYGAIGDGTYHPLSEKFPSLISAQVVYPKVTSLAQSIDWAATQTCADVNRGSEFIAPKAKYVITETVVVPTGTTMRGHGKFDIWADDTNVGTCYLTHGPGNHQRWTDITGADAADDTPMFVAGGPGVYFRNMALRSDTWSVGLFYPSVRQCGFSQILALGFTDACVYIDMTWSEGNTVMNALHPDVFTDGAANEFSGIDFYLRSTGTGSSALKIQGTTRAGNSVATAAEWLWCPGGVSDCRFLHGRLNGSGTNAASFSQDAQLFGVNSFGQGVTLRDVALRLSSGGRYMAKLDRANRTIFDGCYGEYAGGSDIPYFAVTSRTKISNDGIIRVNDKLNGRLLVDEVDRGSLSTVDWLDSRCVSTYRVDGRISTPNIKALDVSQPVEITTYSTDGIAFNYDDGTNRFPWYAMAETNFRPRVNDEKNLGSTSYYWARLYATRWFGSNITAPGDFTLSATSINSAFVVGDATTPVIRPIADGSGSLGTSTYLWLNGRFHNLYSDSGTVSVSDERLKTFADIEAAEKSAALEIKTMIRKFKFNDAIAKKGVDGARWHFGVGAQSVGEVMRKHGLDPAKYSFWCYDEWPAIEAVEAVAAVEAKAAVMDEAGNVIEPAVEAVEAVTGVEAVEAGNQYGINYSELAMFILAAI